MDNSTGDFGRMRSTEYAMGQVMRSVPKARTIREAINVANPSSILTAIAAALDRLSRWIGRSQAEAAKAQQPEIDAMDAEIQGMEGAKKP